MRIQILLLTIASVILTTPAFAATITLKNPQGDEVGTASLQEGGAGVLVQVEIRNLPSGWHGLHFHEVGDCSDNIFQKAGAHLHGSGGQQPHGLLDKAAPHAGDLPNIFVGADGTAKADFFSSFVSLNGHAGRMALLDQDGAALVVHAKADDYTSQPTGNSGDRIACGVIK
jgi:Cu-Zn family superoxide dismutase